MRIIISPAKKMNVDRDSLAVKGMPCFLAETKILMREIKKLSLEEAKALWKCNDRLAELNFRRFEEMDPGRCLTPALLSYEGLQYQYMAPGVFTGSALEYVEEHLRILSGFYGVLRPFDGVVPYRLEMQARLSVEGKKDLYGFWGDKLYRGLMEGNRDGIILNLASREYSCAVEPYVEPGCHFITVCFEEDVDGKLRQKGTLAKMARGEMVRFLSENGVEDADGVKEFDGMGYRYREELSDEGKFVFVKGT
ncbi:peroxide stress protein YaaA [bacterium 1XD8-76]|nr:peroxide stress protein YaaA [bacterium 1XD8-76]